MEGLGSRSGGTIARNAESLMRPSGAAHQHRVRANRVGLVRVGPRSGTRREPVWGSGSPARMNPLGVLRAFRFPAAEGRRGRRAPARRGGGSAASRRAAVSAASVRAAPRSSYGPRTRGGRRRSLRPRRRRPPARPGACAGMRPRSRRGLRTTLQSVPRPALPPVPRPAPRPAPQPVPRPVPRPVRGCVPPRGARVDSSEVVMTGKLP